MKEKEFFNSITIGYNTTNIIYLKATTSSGGNFLFGEFLLNAKNLVKRFNSPSNRLVGFKS